MLENRPFWDNKSVFISYCGQPFQLHSKGDDDKFLHESVVHLSDSIQPSGLLIHADEIKPPDNPIVPLPIQGVYLESQSGV